MKDTTNEQIAWRKIQRVQLHLRFFNKCKLQYALVEKCYQVSIFHHSVPPVSQFHVAHSFSLAWWIFWHQFFNQLPMSSSGLSGYSLPGYQSFFSCSYGRKPETVHEKHLAARVAIVSTATAHLPFFFFFGGGVVIKQ